MPPAVVFAVVKVRTSAAEKVLLADGVVVYAVPRASDAVNVTVPEVIVVPAAFLGTIVPLSVPAIAFVA